MNIIITGASRGIGRELAIKFSENSSNNIIAISRSGEALKSLSESATHKNIYYLASDIADLVKKPSELLKMAENHLHGIDILVNNAGLLLNKGFSDMSPEEDMQVISTNFIAPMQLIRLLLPYYNQGAHIVNISSMSGYQGSAKYPGLSVYGAAKGALAVLTESLAAEFSDDGPSVNCLSPGAVSTEMLKEAFPGYKAPLSAGEMADFIKWFAINGHRFFNGQVLPVSLKNP